MHLSHNLPDSTKCKTVHFIADYWLCQTDQAESCSFRDSFFCQHPECWSFALEYQVKDNASDL